MAFDIEAKSAPAAFSIDIGSAASVGASVGDATVEGDGVALSIGPASSTGSATVAAIASALVVADGSPIGTSTASAIGAATSEATGQSIGSSSAVAFSVATLTTVGSSIGDSTASASGASLVDTAGESEGSSSSGSTDALALAIATGEQVSSSTADATATAVVEGDGISVGSSSASASPDGPVTISGVGSAIGTSSAVGFAAKYAFADYASSLTVRDHVASLTLVGMSYQIGQGDLAPDIVLEAGVNGEPVDLSDSSDFVLRWWKPSGAYVEVPVSAIDLSAGTFTRTWQTGDTDEVGTHRAKLRVLRSNGDPQTFPSDGSFLRWRVT